MKKTLFILLAFGSFATATTSSTLTATSSATVSLTLNVAAVEEYFGANFDGANDIVELAWFDGVWSDENEGLLGIDSNGYTGSKTSFYSFWKRDSSTSNNTVIGDLSSASVFNQQTDWEDISAISVVFSFDTSSTTDNGKTSAAVTILSTNGTATSYSGEASNIAPDGVKGFEATSMSYDEEFVHTCNVQTGYVDAAKAQQLSEATVSNPNSYITTTGTKEAQGAYYGFTLALAPSIPDTLTSGIPDSTAEVQLQSITLMTRNDQSYADIKIVIYEYTANGTTGTYVGISEAQSYTANTDITFSFDSSITLKTTSRYQYMFVAADSTEADVDSFEEYKEKAIMWGLALNNNTSLPEGWGTYKTSNIDGWESKYLPVVSIITTEVVTDYYWEYGDGNWKDAKWSGTDNVAGTLVLPTSGTVNVYFNNNKTASIALGAGVSVTSMTVSAGTYTYTGSDPLTITEALSVSGGSATFEMALEAGSVAVSGAGSMTAQNITAESITVEGSSSLSAASIEASSIILNTTGSLNATGNVEVDTSLQMNAGSLSANQLTGNGSVTINAGKVQLTNGSTAASTTIKDDVVLAGSTSLSGAETNLQIGNVKIETGADVSISDTTLASGATVEGGALTISDATLGAAITVTSGTLVLNGNIKLSDAIAGAETTSYSTNGTTIDPNADYGYKKIDTVYTVVTGDLSGVDASTATWANGGEYTEGKVYCSGTIDTSTYYINGKELNIENLDIETETDTIQLNAGTLIIDDVYTKAAKISSENGTVVLDGKGELSSSDIDSGSGALALAGDGTYHTNGSDSLGNAVSLADTWTGTVNTGNLSGNQFNISGLANENSSIVLGNVEAQNIWLSSKTRAAAPKAKSVNAGDMVLTSGPSALDAEKVTIQSLTLGNRSTAASLSVGGSLEMQGDITLGNEGSYLTATALSDTTKSLNFVMAGELIEKINTETVILTLTEASDAVVVTLNNAETIVRDKYAYSIGWKAADTQVVITPDFNRAYYKDAAETQNGKAGADIITAMVDTVNPQNTAPDSVLAAVINSVDALIDGKATAATDKLMSAVAGASTAAMGAALSGDMQRQLRAIRNRTTTMGVDQSVVNHDMPYFNAWINAEGNRSELNADGTDAGYSMDSWGGTVGFDVDLSPQFTAGMAFTAMYGDFTAESEDMAKADMDTYYLSAFARYVSKRWTHTFVASVGMAETGMERTVSYAGDSYTTKGDSDGITLGAMYEVGYVFALDEDATACLQPVLNFTFTHSSLSGYTETGSDAALKVGDMDMTAFSVGVGARVQAAVGENLYNRSSILEARALAKFNMGDTNCEGDVAFAALPGATGNITSVDMGSVALELGAGLTIPLGQDSDALFFDASAEISSGYTNLNATAGYRINF